MSSKFVYGRMEESTYDLEVEGRHTGDFGHREVDCKPYCLSV